MSKKDESKEIKKSDKDASNDPRSDRDCCYVVDRCGCYVDPCCCSPSYAFCC